MTIALKISYVMEEKVHQCHSPGTGNNLIAIEGLHFEELLLLLIQGVIIWIGYEVISCQKETSCSTRWVSNGL